MYSTPPQSDIINLKKNLAWTCQAYLVYASLSSTKAACYGRLVLLLSLLVTLPVVACLGASRRQSRSHPWWLDHRHHHYSTQSKLIPHPKIQLP